jgi:IMP cyclohydrolase
MINPNGPYPGRQLFLGMTKDKKPAFAYLVTGRSPQSRERLATQKENSIIMGPIDNAPYDPLRHYTAVKYDNNIGLMAVSNGIQTEAIYETYKLLANVNSKPAASYLKRIMDGANYEADNLKTPRISGLISNNNDKTQKPVFFVSIKTAGKPAFVWSVKPKPGIFYGVATYHGKMEKPGAFRAAKGPSELKFSAITSHEIADFIYEISAAMYQGEDIRVCTIGGVRGTDNVWKVAFVNRHQG